MSATTIERIAREREALRRLSVGHTKFREDLCRAWSACS